MLSFMKILKIMTITILKAVSVILILAVMILVLLSIKYLVSGNYDSRDEHAERLRDEIMENKEVITGNNIFHELVEVRNTGTSRKNV